MRGDPQVIRFDRITPALWEQLVPQPRQDRFLEAKWRALVWLRCLRRGLLQSRCGSDIK